MNVGRYVLGLLLLAFALIPLHTASYLWRARVLSQWKGAQARLVEIITDLTVFFLVLEILGSFGLFRVAPVVIVLAAVGVIGIYSARRLAIGQFDSPIAPIAPQPSAPRWANVTALVAVSVIAADWSTWVVAAYHHGMISIDTLWYHMPDAARFVQDGSITPLHYTDNAPDTVFYPATSELLHGFGILLMGNDVLSPIINLLWLALGLLAGWCIGRPFAVAPITLIGSAVLFATPQLTGSQPGGAYDDIVGLALFLSSVAVLVNFSGLTGRSAKVAWVVAAAAAGLAIGVKFTFVAPAVVLTVGAAFVASRGSRTRLMSLWLIVLIVTGGFWYARNFLLVGNPIPSLHLKLGPISLPSPPLSTPTSSIGHFLFDGSAWSRYFIPGLRGTFGPAWWAVLGLSLIGLVAAVITGDRVQRILGGVGLVAGVIFIFTPQYLAVFNQPIFFVSNVRYGDATVLLGLVLLPINRLLSPWRRARWLLVVYVAVLASLQLDASIWSISFFSERIDIPVQGTDELVGLLLGVAVLVIGAVILYMTHRSPGRHIRIVPWFIIGALVVVLGYPLQQTYVRDRYLGPKRQDSFLQPVYSWSQHVNDIRIALAGPLSFLQYPLYGRTLSNYVQQIGATGPNGAFTPFQTCEAFRNAIIKGHYGYVFITTGIMSKNRAEPADMMWMGLGKASKAVIQGAQITANPFAGYYLYTVYKVTPEFSVQGCKGLT